MYCVNKCVYYNYLLRTINNTVLFNGINMSYVYVYIMLIF